MIKLEEDRKTHKYRFLLPTPEENLIAAIIKQAWCDAFTDDLHSPLQKYRKQNRTKAMQMFETDPRNNPWRRSMSYLTNAIQIDEEKLIDGYWKYKSFRVGKCLKIIHAAQAFDVLLKILIKNKGN